MARSIEKRYINTTTGQIHLRLTGDRTKPPLILLHQTASSSAMFELLMEHLCDSFWCIAPDMAGFGSSDQPICVSPSIQFHAAIFWQICDQLKVYQCHLFGHHTGASVAVQMAHDRPHSVRGLGLSGPPLLSDQQIEALRAGLLPIKTDDGGAFLLDSWRRLRKKEPRATLELTLRETLLTLIAAENYPAAYHAVFNHPFESQLKLISCPTVLMAGEQDSLYTSLDLAKACLPEEIEHEVHHIPNAGSYICDRQPELVANILLKFFKGEENS